MFHVCFKINYQHSILTLPLHCIIGSAVNILNFEDFYFRFNTNNSLQINLEIYSTMESTAVTEEVANKDNEVTKKMEIVDVGDKVSENSETAEKENKEKVDFKVVFNKKKIEATQENSRQLKISQDSLT